MSSSQWFGSVMMEASYPSEPVMLEELERVLDSASPSLIDPMASEAFDVSFVIAHTGDILGNIELEVWADSVDLSSVVSSRRISAADFGSDWIPETGRAVDQIIRGSYVIDRTLWRNNILWTDVIADGFTRRDATVWSRLPIPRRFLTRERFGLNYGSIEDDCADPAV